MIPLHRFAMLVSLVAFPVLLGTPRSFVHAQTPATERAKAAPADPTPAAPQIPDNDQYDKLVEAERRYRGIADAGEWPAIPDGDPMKPGQRYECTRLETLEKRLAVEGYRGSTDPAQPSPAAPEPAAPTANTLKPAAPAAGVKAASTAGCEYGPALAGAVRDFQYDRYLVSDGVVGGQTLRQLGKPVADVVSKIDYALQRWRANSANLSGSYILVNIPTFELAVYEGRREVMRMPVVVGLPDWETPEMSDKIETLVINPSWNIPKSIADSEVLPKHRKDKGYFKREGIVADGDGTLSQKPGPRNPLGRLKFMLPNRQDIYLHDTPGKQRFASPARAFSHGCVRVEKPVDLAAYLLKDDPQWSKERIQSAIDSADSKTVKLERPMPVHLLYIPALVSEDGRLRVAPDIYDKVGNAQDESASEPAPTEEDEFLPDWP
jgi:murein L,D-transpeptidase YcbB/YkuD